MSKPTTKLTDAAIQRYRPTNQRREIPDAACPGLRLIVQATGSKSFALRFRKPNGVPAKLTLGPYDGSRRELKDVPVIGQPLTLAAARALAATVNRERALGIDVVGECKAAKSRQGAAAAHREANTFAAALQEFFVDHKTRKGARPRRWREDAAALGLRFPPGSDPATVEPTIIRGGLADIWRDKTLAEIDGHAVFTAVDAARRLGSPGRSRRLFAALSSFFSWALRQRRITANPCVGVFKPLAPAARERVLSDVEIVTFWKACEKVGVPFGALFRVMLLTGCRLREASDMARDEIVDGAWAIPGDRTKNGKSLALVLPPLAREIVETVPRIGSDFVFTTNGATPVSGFSKAKRQVDAAMAEIAGKPVVPWRLHDLRRTAASGMAALGVQLPVIEKILNHVSGSFGGIIGVYQRHEYAAEKREALVRWAAHVGRAVTEGPNNIIVIRRPG